MHKKTIANYRKRLKNRAGFTIVELMVVIAVLGILVSIVVVTYPMFLERTHDSQRKSDLEQIAAALNAYALKNNNYVEGSSGCGFLGVGNGWFNAGPNAYFPASIHSCLQSAQILTQSISDPSGCVSDTGGECGSYQGDPTPAYMKATCLKNGAKVTYLFAYLETEPAKDSEVDAVCDNGTVAGFDATSQKWGTNYGMNYYITVR